MALARPSATTQPVLNGPSVDVSSTTDDCSTPAGSSVTNTLTESLVEVTAPTRPQQNLSNEELSFAFEHACCLDGPCFTYLIFGYNYVHGT